MLTVTSVLDSVKYTQPDDTDLAHSQAGPPNSIACCVRLPVLPWSFNPHLILFNQFTSFWYCRWPDHIPYGHEDFPYTAQELQHWSWKKNEGLSSTFVMKVCSKTDQNRRGSEDSVEHVREHVRAEETVGEGFAAAVRSFTCWGHDGTADCEA